MQIVCRTGGTNTETQSFEHAVKFSQMRDIGVANVALMAKLLLLLPWTS